MNTLLIVGTIIGAGYLLGELASKVGLPRVSGYILAGLALNPGVTGVVSRDFVQGTDAVTSVALAILTFAVGGTLAIAPLKELGRGIIMIALGEAELAALFVILGSMIVLPFFLDKGAGFITMVVPLAVLLGALASPTDPSATLAVIHQYKAKGQVSFSIMAAAALDDAIGIINFSVGMVIASFLIAHGHHVAGGGISALIKPVIEIGGALVLGVVSGLGFHYIPRLLRAESDGLLLVLIIGLLTLCYGLATAFGLDQLLATMTMGMAVVNFKASRDRIFRLLEEYIEPLVFVLFFTISGMLLDVAVLFRYFPLVLFFVLFRTAGKLTGAYLGATIGRAPQAVRRYTGFGLIPQGGIVIGLALILQREEGFADLSSILLSVVIGATVLHELIGPLTAKLAIQKAGEITPHPPEKPGISPHL